MTDYTDLKRRLGEAIISQAHEDRRITSGPLAERLIHERMDALGAIATLEAEVARYRDALDRISRLDDNAQFMRVGLSDPPLRRACVIARAALTAS